LRVEFLRLCAGSLTLLFILLIVFCVLSFLLIDLFDEFRVPFLCLRLHLFGGTYFFIYIVLILFYLFFSFYL
jgi:hypothetical protein